MFAFAKEKGVASPEEFALTLGDRFLGGVRRRPAPGSRSRSTPGTASASAAPGHDHSFVRRGGETRTTVVTLDDSGDDRRAWVVSGLKDLVVLKSTGSEF